MRIEYSARGLADVGRLVDFLVETYPQAAQSTAALIVEAVDLLRRHPMIGRSRPGGLRELVISRGRSGYVALYQVDIVRDRILVLAIRHQRERGFAPQGSAD